MHLGFLSADVSVACCVSAFVILSLNVVKQVDLPDIFAVSEGGDLLLKEELTLLLSLFLLT